MGMKPRPATLAIIDREPVPRRIGKRSRTHIESPHRNGHTICGQVVGMVFAAGNLVAKIDGEIDPARVTCGTCRKYVMNNPREFSRPVHYYEGEGTSKAPCGQELMFLRAEEFVTDFGKVTCAFCAHALYDRAPPQLTVDMADILIHNALAHAVQNGYRLSQKGCLCGSRSALNRKLVCIGCAVLVYRGINPDNVDVEDELSRILAVPREWVLSLIGGWDGDRYHRNHPNRAAFFMGRKLWKRHAKQHA